MGLLKDKDLNQEWVVEGRILRKELLAREGAPQSEREAVQQKVGEVCKVNM